MEENTAAIESVKLKANEYIFKYQIAQETILRQNDRIDDLSKKLRETQAEAVMLETDYTL